MTWRGTWRSLVATMVAALALVGPAAASAAPTLTVAPESATKAVNTQHTVTATLTDENGPIVDRDLRFSVSGVNSSFDLLATTDANGQATYAYTGTEIGTDDVVVTYDADFLPGAEATAVARVLWIDAYLLALDPPSATKPVNTAHTVQAAVSRNGAAVGAGVSVQFTVSGTHSVTQTATTNASGLASFTYTGTTAGSDVIVGCVDATGDLECEAVNTASVQWTDTYTLDVTPSSATTPVDTQHTVSAAARNSSGPLAGGVPVRFTVTGANPSTQTVLTNGNGIARLEYTGADPGTDQVSACLQAAPGDPCEAEGSASVEWTAVSPGNEPPDCSGVAPDVTTLPRNHKFTRVTLDGATDPDGDPVDLVITAVHQDEPVDEPDAKRVAWWPTKVDLRNERAGKGDGRVYVIAFSVDDGQGGACDGSVRVTVPHDSSGDPAVDSGARFDAFGS